MSFKKILAALAPTLGTALGGPLGGMAAKFAVDKLLPGNNVEAGSDAADMLEKLVMGATPEQMAQLKVIDNDFKTKMRELGIREEELAAQDRNSARQLAIAKGMGPQVILSTVYTIGYCAVMYIFISGDVVIADSIKSEFNIVLGVLTAAQTQIMNFWFGSSAGSKEKTAAIAGA